MAPNSLSPASLLIDYHSAFGAHKMTLPTLEWIPTGLSGALGSYTAWNGVVVDGETMVNELVDGLRPFFPATTHFDQATAYTQASPTSSNIPRASVALTQVGTNPSTNPSAAVSATFMFKTLGNHDAKVVCLDVPFGSGWLAPILPSDFTADMLTLEGYFTDIGRAWSGRDDTRPSVLRKLTFDVNEKLQAIYFR